MALQAGNRLFAQKKYREAMAVFLAHAEGAPPDGAHAYVGAAKCARIVDPPLAERYYRAALTLDPEHFLALRGLAEALPASSPERLQLLERATSLRPDLLALLELGDYCRSVLKDYARAHSAYARAQEAHPRDQTAYVKLNELCRRQGLTEEAQQWSARWQAIRNGTGASA